MVDEDEEAFASGARNGSDFVARPPLSFCLSLEIRSGTTEDGRDEDATNQIYANYTVGCVLCELAAVTVGWVFWSDSLVSS